MRFVRPVAAIGILLLTLLLCPSFPASATGLRDGHGAVVAPDDTSWGHSAAVAPGDTPWGH
ncbi:hypothetical protein [Amycolatopsis sp. NPDC003861]